MKKIFSFFAIAAVVLGMASCENGGNGGNDPEVTEFKVIGLPDAYVKCVVDDVFAEQGYVLFYFHTNPNFQLDGHNVPADKPGVCLCIGLGPQDRNNLVGTFTFSEHSDNKAIGWQDFAENKNWTDHREAHSGTITVTQNADKSYNFELDFILSKTGKYKGTITGIRE